MQRSSKLYKEVLIESVLLYLYLRMNWLNKKIMKIILFSLKNNKLVIRRKIIAKVNPNFLKSSLLVLICFISLKDQSKSNSDIQSESLFSGF